MAERRRYSRKTKASAVIAAEMSSVMAAAETTGIPRKTIEYWVEAPEFATLRRKTREDLAEGSIVLAHLAQAELTRKIRHGDVEPRDLAVIYGIAIDKGQLLSGQATARLENRDLTSGLDDHEKEAMANLLKRAIEEKV